MAIICQDVTVVLAFDTRERLIQWQVKIANNLGEGKETPCVLNFSLIQTIYLNIRTAVLFQRFFYSYCVLTWVVVI